MAWPGVGGMPVNRCCGPDVILLWQGAETRAAVPGREMCRPTALNFDAGT